VIDELEPLAVQGGLILDWHTCDAFPERWIDLVVVLQCNHSRLWERLEKRYVFNSSVCYHELILDGCVQKLYTQKDPRKQ
jgi:AAA domain